MLLFDERQVTMIYGREVIKLFATEETFGALVCFWIFFYFNLQLGDKIKWIFIAFHLNYRQLDLDRLRKYSLRYADTFSNCSIFWKYPCLIRAPKHSLRRFL